MSKFEITDEILYRSCENVENHLLDQLPNEDELNYNFSNKFERKMEKLIKHENQNPMVNKIYKYSKNVVAILVVTIIGLFTLTMSVEALRDQLFDVIKEVYDKFTSYVFSTTVDIDESSFEIKLPGYLPDGFDEIERLEGSNEVIVIYKNNDGREITYHYYKIIDGQTSTDTEGAEIDKVLVNNLDANYIEKGNTKKLTWHDDRYFYGLSMSSIQDSNKNVNKKELISIAESIK
ncbi:DUF4367 domain-containing protein [[Clostridium] dakarense]|uniref:DUF4367 domain-containing protein n=1 Tax=Faecalimicrobium dakarense TaxID=1301100 RepID=UPI0004B58DA0|nr:DUF4367 domain-containing protein [[Clostridium] dakarense]